MLEFAVNRDRKVEVVKSEAFAASTKKAREAQWKRYVNFCNDYRMDPAPITPDKVCRFLVHLGESLKYSTINNYVSALNALAKLAENYQDLCQDCGVTLVLRGLRHLLGDAKAQMDQILPDDLAKIFQQIDLSDEFQLSVWIAVCIAFRSLLRKSNFFVAQEDEIHLLQGFSFVFRVKKQSSFLQDLLTFQYLIVGGVLCAASQLKVYLDRYKKGEEAPLISCGGKPIQYPKALAMFKKWCTSAKVDKKVGFHSLRRGSAMYMDKIHIPLHHIQQSGDWQSRCVLNYLSSDLDQRRDIDTQVARSLMDM